MSDPNLVTACNFNGRDYFIKMNVANNILELVVTDKLTGEDWQCSYDATYVENITQKTGNFKQFEIFITMLKSGLLKTSNCVYLDLMTFEDLDSLRNHRVRGPWSQYHIASQSNNKRRYLILTYTVEFDRETHICRTILVYTIETNTATMLGAFKLSRIHYPLPLEYCGPPDPLILQQQVNRLEHEVLSLREQLSNKSARPKIDSKLTQNLQKRIDELSTENKDLKEEIKQLNYVMGKRPKTQIQMLQNAILKLEKSVITERRSHHRLVDKLRREKAFLIKELQRLKNSDRPIKSKMTNSNNRESRPRKRMSDPGTKDHSPKKSPLRRQGSWDSCLIPVSPRRSDINNRKNKSRSTSRGSQSSDLAHLLASMESPPEMSPRRKRPASLSSRHSSPISRTSSSESRRNVIPGFVYSLSIRDKARTTSPRKRRSDLDFSNLENRIQALQIMLQDGMILK